MAKQKGVLIIQGTLGDLTFYKLDGKDIIRTRGGVDKKRIATDPAFKRTRENMKEFGASAKVGKSLRHGFASSIKKASDRSLSGRITGLMKRINGLGKGVRGERSFDLLTHKGLLEGLEFDRNTPLETVFYAPFSAPSLDASRSIATWVVPDFDASSYVDPPEGATHFKLLLACAAVSNFTYVPATKTFEPTNPAEHETSGFVYSTKLPVRGMVGSDTTLSVDLKFAKALPETVAVFIAIGIVFYQKNNSDLYELSSGNAIKIVSVR